jgi:hypothetical protein
MKVVASVLSLGSGYSKSSRSTPQAVTMYTGMENKGDAMVKIEKTGLGILGGILGLATIGWIGLKIHPRKYPHPSTKTREIGDFTLPDDLPAPVARHFLAALGLTPPKMENAVVWGRCFYKIAGFWTPMRFKSYLKDGRYYLREMQITWFGFPFLNRHHSYKNGMATRKGGGLLPSVETGAEIKQSHFLSMWAESMWMPAILVSEQACRWEAIDEATAWLIVSSDNGDEPILVRFNPKCGLIEEIVAWRYRHSEGQKTTWRVSYSDWKPYHGLLLPGEINFSWEDSGTYAVFKADRVEFNPDISI